MNIAPTASNASTQTQQVPHLSSSSTATDNTASSDADQGDTVTISEQGKQLASGATVNEVKVSQDLQDAIVKQKTLTAKIAAAKEDGGNVGGLNAQLTDANKTVSKDRLQMNQA